jgi:hypothetical protein
MQMFARRDWDRARISSSRFQRVELRLMIQLAIARGALSDKEEEKGNPSKRMEYLFKNRAAID